jgi:hypothetical protein
MIQQIISYLDQSRPVQGRQYVPDKINLAIAHGGSFRVVDNHDFDSVDFQREALPLGFLDIASHRVVCQKSHRDWTNLYDDGNSRIHMRKNDRICSTPLENFRGFEPLCLASDRTI